FSGAGQLIEVEQLAHTLQHGRQAAGIVEILHQILARGAHVHQIGRALPDVLETLERDVDAGATRHGDDVDQSIGGTAQRHQYPDGVVEGLLGKDVARLEVFPNHVHDAPAAKVSHAAVVGVYRWNRG